MNTRHYYLRLLRTLALAALTAAATAACSDDNDENDGREPVTPDGGIPVTFTANINPGSDADPDTRTILTPDGNGGFTVEWIGANAPGDYDTILIWAAQRNTLANSGSPKYYIPRASGASSPLMPRPAENQLTLSSAGEWTFTAIYGYIGPGVGEADASVSPLTQSAPGKTDHIAERDFSVATATQNIAADDDAMPQDISLGFKHMLAALQLRITNQTGEELTVREIRLSAAGGEITTRKDYDVVQGKWNTTGEEKAAYLQLTADNFPALAPNATPQDLHMLLFPEPGHSRTNMTVTVITSRGEYSRTRPAPDGGFLAGKNYLTDITIKSSGLDPDKETWTETISTAEELAAFRNRVNAGNNYAAATVRLAANINLAGETWTTPIGTDFSNSFKGTFDGGGHLISNLTVNNGSEGYAGLFGIVSGGTVRNLCVSGTVITTGLSAGGIVGSLNDGIMENCIFSGEVSGKETVGGIAGTCYNSRIAGCHTKGKVTATEEKAGGIAGSNAGNSTITDCYSEAEVVSTTHSAGGIVGYNSSTITRCYATGQVSSPSGVGGIVGGQGNGTVTDCIALNPVLIRTEGTETTFGRIVGRKAYNSIVTITKCSAFAGMTLPDGVTATSAADDIHGAALTADDCLTGADYISCGMSADNGWAFSAAAPWQYLPWNPAFETFSGIQPADYCIKVPDHLKAPVIP